MSRSDAGSVSVETYVADGNYVFFQWVEDITDKGCRLVVLFAYDSAPVIRAHGVGKLLAEVRKEVPEVTMINFENVQGNLVDITLRGEKAKGDAQAAKAFGREVVVKLDAIVTRIVD